MGALFNTPKTLLILKFLNNHYTPGAKFNQARANKEYDTLRDFGNYPDSYSCAVKLGLHDATVNPRWKKWLDILDGYQPPGSPNGGWLVRTMMADALDPGQDQSCNGIEFFAVPASSFSVQYPASAVNDPNNSNLHTRVIIVQTNTIDVMLSSAKTRRRRR